MKSKKETFKISILNVDMKGNRSIWWQKVKGERIDDETAIRRETGKGWIVWDIKSGNIICTKRAKSIADAITYYEDKYKAIIKSYRKSTSYAKILERSIELFNDPKRELKENGQEETTGSNKKEEKQEEAAKAKTEAVEVPQVKALPAPKKEETSTTAAATTEAVNKASDTVTASPATDRQARYLAALAKKLHNRQIIDVSINYNSLDKETASRLIDESLKAIERGRRGNKKVPASYLLNSFRAAA